MDIKDIEGKTIFWSNKWDKLWLLILPTTFLINIFTTNVPAFWFWTILILASSINIYVLYHMFHPKFAWVDVSTIKGKEIQQQAFKMMYNDNGVFSYKEDGFNFRDKNKTVFIAWADIEYIFAYKKDLYTYDEINIDVFIKGKFRLHLTEQIPGWYQFVANLKKVFPTIDKEFEIKIMFPAFETNMTLVYDRLEGH